MPSKKLALLAIIPLATLGATATSAVGATPWFAPNQQSAIANGMGPGPAPRGTASADFTGDGKPDLVTVGDFANGNILMAPNTGNGTFGAASQVAGTSGTQGLDAGDLNMDGKADVAAMTTSEVRIRFGNGAGGFTAGGTHPFSLGGQVHPLIVDVDGDGDNDIVAPTFTAIQTLLNNGDGTFVAGPTSQVSGASVIAAIAVAKLDADGRTDLFATDGSSGTTFALRGDGTGRFSVSGSVYASGLVPEDVAAIDLNGDGFDDAATIGSFSFSLSTALTDGTGKFTTPAGTNVQYGGPGPTSASVGDFDRDGRQDLVISSLANPSATTLTVLAGNGTVTMRKVGEFSTAPFGQNPVLADYDGDSKLDIAVLSGGAISFLHNTTP